MTTEKYEFTIGGKGVGLLDTFCKQLNRPRKEGMNRLIWVLEMYLRAKKKGYRLALIKDDDIRYLEFQ